MFSINHILPEEALLGRNGKKNVETVFHVWFRFCQDSLLFSEGWGGKRAGARKVRIPAGATRKTCQVMMPVPFYFCMSCK